MVLVGAAVVKSAELSDFFIRIIPTATSLFTFSKLSLTRNNVRAFTQGKIYHQLVMNLISWIVHKFHYL